MTMKGDTLRPELKEKICEWLVSFHKLDPRYKILTFFNQVASDGADNLCNDDEDYDFGPPKPELTQFEKKLNDAFNTTSILTVWRPCSNDAMRLMMEGSGVGKGLDIKGKSAKQGDLSAFVPFLQISENDHKQKVSPISPTALLRVYFKSQASRDHAVSKLEDKAEQVKAQVQKENREKEQAMALASAVAATDSTSERKGHHHHGKFRFSGQSGARSRSNHKSGVVEALLSPGGRERKANSGEDKIAKHHGLGKESAMKNNRKHRKPKVSKAADASTEASESSVTRLGQEKGVSVDTSPSKKDGDFFGRMFDQQQSQNEEKECDAQHESTKLNIQSSFSEEDKNSCEACDKPTLTISKKTPLLNKFRAAALAVKEETKEANAAASSGADKITRLFDQFKEKVATECKTIDDYAPEHYGIECSQRLFWKTFVLDQDITRTKEQETGRPSTPGFQDANMYSLGSGMKNKTDPLPVLLQMSCDDPGNEMKPQTMVMAYEENKKVVPVVSDFDGFLLGWRREALWFGCDLPREQEDLMLWCVKHIEELLDSPPSTESWTSRWLDILKKEKKKGFHPEIPPYGFGDPKSYAIMEEAALRLIDTGAVRHGSECFNYYFPQEIDDMFLVISDTLSPVPWKYVDVTELQQILSDRIDDGFMFPLNPKWILCDPGWKNLYDKLLSSDALYADLSKDVWFPPYSGVRKKIDEIYKRHPYGFQKHANSFNGKDLSKDSGPYHLSGQAAAELAELELENYEGDVVVSDDGVVEVLDTNQRRRRGRRCPERARSMDGISCTSGSSTDGQSKARGLFGRHLHRRSSSADMTVPVKAKKGRFGGLFGRRKGGKAESKVSSPGDSACFQAARLEI